MGSVVATAGSNGRLDERQQVSLETFRDNGGPLLYMSPNRTAVAADLRSVLIWIAFATLFAIFLVILPGIRKEKISTFISVTISLFVGATILVTNCGTNWHVGEAAISSPYRAFSREKIHATIGVYIGLKSVNITLQALPSHWKHKEINFNERFYWIEPDEMKLEYQTALARGLPYPILTVADYLSQDEDGFGWSRQYRLAGHYASTILWFSFLTWIMSNVLLCAVPRYGAYTLQLTGALMLVAVAVYSLLLPSPSAHPLSIPFEGGTLTFAYGCSFYAALIAGAVAFVFGAVYAILDTLFPNRFSTILQVDYDTPYRYYGLPNDSTVIRTLSVQNAPVLSTMAGSSKAGSVMSSSFLEEIRSRGLSLQEEDEILSRRARLRFDTNVVVARGQSEGVESGVGETESGAESSVL